MRTLVVCAAMALGLFAAESSYHQIAKYPVSGDGSWDYVTLDSGARRLYLSHGDQVNVLDADTGKAVGAITDTPGVHGIAIAGRYGYTTNGRENKVSVFDPATLALVKKIDTGKGPDGIYYDAGSKRVFTCNHGSDDITAIDAEKAEVIGAVKVEGAGEAMVTGKDGMIYVNLEDKAEVAVFDPKSLAVKRRMPIGIAETPTGLAYDAKTNHLFIGCRQKPMLVVMDAASGKVIANFTIGTGVDWVSWDPASKLAFASTGEGTLGIIHQKSATEYEDAGSVKTEPGAKTMALDPKTQNIFLPTAEVVMKPATEQGKRPQRTVTPGTFHVLVYSR